MTNLSSPDIVDVGNTIEVLWPVAVWGTVKSRKPTNSWWKATVLEISHNGVEHRGKIEYHEGFGHPPTTCEVRFLEGRLVDYGSPSRECDIQMPSMQLKWRIADPNKTTTEERYGSASDSRAGPSSRNILRNLSNGTESVLIEKITEMGVHLKNVEAILRSHSDIFSRIIGNVHENEECAQNNSEAPNVTVSATDELPQDASEAHLMRKLAELYEKGCEADHREACAWYNRCALAGDVAAAVSLAKKYCDGTDVEQDYSTALSLFRRAEAAGSTEAKNYLGVMYENGNGIPADLQKAFELYLEASNRGSAAAKTNLALMYETGTGVRKDDIKAASLYQEAITGGDISAMNDLGVMYEGGRGVQKDICKAFSLYSAGAKDGDSDAINNLAMLYDKGNGVEVNKCKAISLYEKAASRGNGFAMYNLACMWETGDGVERNLERAAQLYKDASDTGNLQSKTCLADMYRNGEGIEMDFDKARALYEEAVQCFDAEAMCGLAHMYENGLGVDRNLKKAWQLYVDSHLHGSLEGSKGMERLDKNKDEDIVVKDEHSVAKAATGRVKKKRRGRHGARGKTSSTTNVIDL